MLCLALSWHLWNISEFNTFNSSCWTSPSRRFLLELWQLESHLLPEGAHRTAVIQVRKNLWDYCFPFNAYIASI